MNGEVRERLQPGQTGAGATDFGPAPARRIAGAGSKERHSALDMLS